MKNILLEEELRKIKFLFDYSPGRTLNENLVSEQAKTTQKLTGAAKAAVADLKILSDAEKAALSAKLARKPISGMKNADDLLKGITDGVIKGTELGKAHIQIFKSSTNPKIIEGMSKNLAKAGQIDEWFLVSKQRKKSFDRMMAENGYSKAHIDAMKKEAPHLFTNVKGAAATGKVGSVKNTGKTTGKPKTAPSPKNKQSGEKLARQKGKKIKELGTWQKVKDHWAKYWKAYGITLGALALAYWLIFPSAEDVDATVDVTDDTPVVPDTSTTTPAPSTGIQYRVCSSFPMTIGCVSEMIREIQNCLPQTTSTGQTVKRDGRFGPVTNQALIDKGYSTKITQEVYNEIKSECGGTAAPSPAPEPMTPMQSLPIGQVPQSQVNLGEPQPQTVPTLSTSDLGTPQGDLSGNVQRAQNRVDRAQKRQLRRQERRDRRADRDQQRVDQALLRRDDALNRE